MNVSDYLKAASTVAAQGKIATCNYCKTKTLYAGDYCICSGCEAIIYPAKGITDQQVDALTSAIHDAYAAQDYDKALQACDGTFSTTKSYWFVYLKGIILISKSNYETALIRYDKPGFMDDNAEHRRLASAIYADARLNLYRSIELAKAASKDSPALSTDYMVAITSIKLGDYTQAKHYIEALEAHKSSLAINYLKMALFTGLGQYDDALKNATALMNTENFSINAMAYAAHALFKKKRLKEARLLIDNTVKYVSTPSVLSLHETIYGRSAH